MKKYIYIAFLFCSHAVFSQKSTQLSSIHFDKPFYIIGDTAWFQIFMPQSFLYEQSIANVLLIDPEDQIVSNFYLPIFDEMSLGYFSLPYTSPSGAYQVFINLTDESHRKIPLLSHSFLLLNEETGLNKLSVPISENEVREFSDELNISIEIEQERVQPRDQIIMHIETRDETDAPISAQLSMAVTEDYGANQLKAFSIYEVAKENYKIANKILLKGRVNNTGVSMSEGYVAAFHQETGEITIVNTNHSGEFRSEIEPFKGKQNLQFRDLFGRNMKVEFDRIAWPISNREENIIDISELLPFVKLNSERKKINYLFEQPKGASKVSENTAWKHIPDDSLRPADYEPYPDLIALLENIITPLKIKNRNQVNVARMLNPETKTLFPEEPLFLINKVISTFSEVLKLRINDMEHIDFYNQVSSLRLFGPLGRNGVVAIQTLFPQERLNLENTKVLYGIQEVVSYPIKVDVNKSPQLPSLSSLIYWNPEIRTNETGKTTISFFHSDEIGQFSIRILARGDNHKIGTHSIKYKVID